MMYIYDILEKKHDFMSTSSYVVAIRYDLYGLYKPF